MFFGWSRKGGEGGRGEQNRGSKPGEQTGKEYAPFAVVFMQLIAHLCFVPMFGQPFSFQEPSWLIPRQAIQPASLVTTVQVLSRLCIVRSIDSAAPQSGGGTFSSQDYRASAYSENINVKAIVQSTKKIG